MNALRSSISTLKHDDVGELTFGGIRLRSLVAHAKTPTYVYDLSAIAADAREVEDAFGDQRHLVCYAVKANTAGPIVRTLAREGCGADVVSGPELLVARGCGIGPESIVFSGVAKTNDEIDLAISENILAIQTESVEEIDRVAARAQNAGKVAAISIRLNPGLEESEIATHAHITTGHDEAKFGVSKSDFARALERVSSSAHVRLVGLSVHVGSQFLETSAYLAAARFLFDLARDVRRQHPISFLDTGGGFGIDYTSDENSTVRPGDFVRAVCSEMRGSGHADLTLVIEPGRSLVAKHGVLVTTVIQRKESAVRRWIMIDAGMNDLLRPALYQAHHRIVPLTRMANETLSSWRVVGPVCESSDDFGFHPLPDRAFDHAAILDVGAYGYTMASRYNGRPAPAEIFLEHGSIVAKNDRHDWGEWVADRVGIGKR